MWNFADTSFWLMAGWCLHALFGLLAFLGVVLFVIWAARLKANILAKLVVWLLVVGVVGMLLTSALGWKGMRGLKGEWKNCGDLDDDEMETEEAL